MQQQTRRWVFIGLVLVGILSIGGVAYWFFVRPNTPQAVEPAPAPNTDAGTLPPAQELPPAPAFQVPTTPPPAQDSAQERERKAREALFRQARDVVSRAGSYSNADGFAAIAMVYTEVTPEVRSFLEGERTRLQREYASLAQPYSQTTRALSARLTQEVAVLTAQEVDILVEVQQRREEGGQSSVTQRRATARFVRQGSVWVMSRLTWQEASL
jgi:type IV secretory pathway VirB10-like protein